MLSAALYELLDDEGKKEYRNRMGNLGLEGVSITPEESFKCGIKGTHMKVLVDGAEEHEHAHDHHHEHHHSSLHDIEHIIGALDVPDEVKKDAVCIYKLIADAESHAHGKPVNEIHFHEVGTKDAVADIVSACLLMSMIAPDEVLASSINTGSGHVHCAHGILPVPAPATAFILKDVPIYQGHIKSELCTPTGAALLKHFVSDFCEMPVMKVSCTGYGMGKKDFEQANCVRAFIGEREGGSDVVTMLSFNVDDMTPEALGYASEKLLASGAKEVYTVPAGMKKSRPGTEVNVICAAEDKDKIVRLIFAHTTTIGIRESIHRRYVLDRKIEEVDTQYGPVRLKKAEGYGVSRSKWEYDDIARIASETGNTMEYITGMLDAGFRHGDR